MPDATLGYIDEPRYDQHYLVESVGYVTSIWAEQEDSRDQIAFLLDITYVSEGVRIPVQQVFSIYLDLERGPVVAFAQLELLRMALESMDREIVPGSSTGSTDPVEYVPPLLVRVVYSFGDSSKTVGHAYRVQVIYTSREDVTMQDFYRAPTRWYTHVE